MKSIVSVVSLIALFVCSFVSGQVFAQSIKSEVKPVLDIPSLAGKSPAELEKVLGKSKVKTPITNYPEQMPGEFRDYRIKSSQINLTLYGLMVRYYQGRAVSFTLDLPNPTASPEEALAVAGIGTKGISPTIKAPMATRWKDVSFNGVAFEDVAVLIHDGKFATVQAKLP